MRMLFWSSDIVSKVRNRADFRVLLRGRIQIVAIVLGAAVTCGSAVHAGDALEFNVNPQIFDPAHSDLVFSSWLSGLGCPNNVSYFDANTSSTQTTSDPACNTSDPADKQVQGLLLVKTGPTSNNAAAGAQLNVKKGTVLTELGYDIRKPGPTTPPSAVLTGDVNDPRGSHCGAGAPRFNVSTVDGNFYFVGCSISPGPTSTVSGNAWQRLRFGNGTVGSVMGANPAHAFAVEPITAGVANHGIQILFDEGSDTGPDNFGAAVLDNIDVNGTLVGRQ